MAEDFKANVKQMRFKWVNPGKKFFLEYAVEKNP